MPTYLEERTPTQRDLELSRLAPPTCGMHPLSDPEVLLAGGARIAENRANSERWLCFVEFYRRRLATEDADDEGVAALRADRRGRRP